MEGHALLATHLRRVDATLPALDRIREMGRAYYRFGMRHKAYYALMFDLHAIDAPRREAVQRELYTLLLLRDAVAAGMERGELRRDLDSMVVTNALWAKVHGITALAVSGLLMETAPGQHVDVLEAVLDATARWLAP